LLTAISFPLKQIAGLVMLLSQGLSLSAAGFDLLIAKANKARGGGKTGLWVNDATNWLLGTEGKSQKDLDADAKQAEDKWAKVKAEIIAQQDIFNKLGEGMSDPAMEAAIKKILDSIIAAKNSPTPQQSFIRNIQADFAEAREAAVESIDRIREKYEEYRGEVQTATADNTKSHRTAAVELGKATELEIQEIQAVIDALEKKKEQTRKRIAADPGYKSIAEKEAAVKAFETEWNKFQNGYVRQYAQLRKQADAENRAGVREAANVERLDFRERMNLIRQRAQDERAIEQEKFSQGYSDAVTYNDAVFAAAQKEHDAEVALIQKEMEDLDERSVRYKELVGDLILENDRWTAQERLNSLQRQRIIEDELNKKREFEARYRQAQLDAEETMLAISQTIENQQGYTSLSDRLYQKREQELAHLQALKAAELEYARAKNAESEETRKLTLELEELGNERLRAVQARVNYAYQNISDPNIRQIVVNATASKSLAEAEWQQSRVASDREMIAPLAGTSPVMTAMYSQLSKEYDRLSNEIKRIREAFSLIPPTTRQVFGRLADALVGDNISQVWGTLRTTNEKIAVAGLGVLKAFQNIGQMWSSGFQQGGVLGGVGGVMSGITGALSSNILKKIPVIGEFLPLIGGVLSFVGTMFTRAAKKIAEDVKASFQKTLDNYQNGNATLVETLNALERQRADAIIRLSGKKGGKDELNKLLPEFDREIQELKKQQEEIITSFNDSLEALRLHSDTLIQVKKQWQDINKQVKDYIGAGGDYTKAAEYLSLSLQKIREDAVTELDKAEQDAIQDALKLNDLLEERNRLVEDFKQKEFDLINQDAIERRQAGSVVRGRELEQLRKENQDALAKIDAEIALTNKKVEKQREVFNISTDVEALHRRDEELTLAALDMQIQKLRDLKSIADSITLGENGQWGSAMFQPTALTIQVNVTAPVGDEPPEDWGRTVADSVAEELERRYRMAPVA
jgi:hypothetical protein